MKQIISKVKTRNEFSSEVSLEWSAEINKIYFRLQCCYMHMYSHKRPNFCHSGMYKSPECLTILLRKQPPLCICRRSLVRIRKPNYCTWHRAESKFSSRLMEFQSIPRTRTLGTLTYKETTVEKERE